ncbi:MAG: hypothetical protein HZB50_04185 [Chloroflexi bacterium]|nr:hypothetical protein [Chloroflexota bacterium]
MKDNSIVRNQRPHSRELNYEAHERLALVDSGAGVDSAWEQKKLEARKKILNRAESPASSDYPGDRARRFVGRLY